MELKERYLIIMEDGDIRKTSDPTLPGIMDDWDSAMISIVDMKNGRYYAGDEIWKDIEIYKDE